MSDINKAYINALLADAAYVNVTKGMGKTEMVNVLRERMTSSQANYIAANFEVASNIDTSDIPLVGSGFDAVVWRGRADGDYLFDQIGVEALALNFAQALAEAAGLDRTSAGTAQVTWRHGS